MAHGGKRQSLDQSLDGGGGVTLNAELRYFPELCRTLATPP